MTITKKMQLSFHGSFACKKEELSVMLREANIDRGLKDSRKDLMARTGLGNEKVLRIKSWVTRAGLVEENKLSPEGKIIWECDPELEKLPTDWFMHFYLSLGDKKLSAPPKLPSDWGGWTYFVYEFIPQYRSFTEDDLFHHAALVFDSEKPNPLKKNLRILLRAYTDPYALAGCKFLILEDGQYNTDQARRPNPYLVGYFLAKLWERDFPEDGSVLTDSLLTHPMGLGPVLGLDKTGVQEELNRLESLGIIEQRRAVPPFQVVPRWTTPLDLLEKAYDCDR
jgi:hypothetical protein